MTLDQLNAYITLLTIAYSAGQEALATFRSFMDHTLSADEKKAVLVQWEDNERRARANAGL